MEISYNESSLEGCYKKCAKECFGLRAKQMYRTIVNKNEAPEKTRYVGMQKVYVLFARKIASLL